MSVTPTSLSKEKLKSELVAHNIPLPASSAKKEAYIQLYEKFVMNPAKLQKMGKEKLSEFSSDEEESFKTPKAQMRQRTIFTSTGDVDRKETSLIVDGINISQLSDDELRQSLLNFNETVGPIVDTTRSVYERRLARWLQGEIGGETPNGKVQTEEYSDSEEEIEESAATDSKTSFQSTSSHHSSNIRATKILEPKTSLQTDDSENVLTYRTSSRDTPTPRRSLRDDIRFTPTDRKLYADIIKKASTSKNNCNVGGVVEDVPEPDVKLQNTNKSSLMKKVVLFLLVLGILILLVYYNMEVNDTQEINHLLGKS